MKYRITPIDPIISRDARKFVAGSPMHSLNWLSQSVIAGAVRTKLWKASEDPDSNETLNILRKIKVRGSFPILKEKIYFPRPLDIVKSSEDIYQIKPVPMPENSGANMPLEGLQPAMPINIKNDFKPEKLNLFWSRNLMLKWLEHGGSLRNPCAPCEGGEGHEVERGLFSEENFIFNENETLAAPSFDERIHVCIDPLTGTSKTGNLFSTTGLDFIRKDEKTFTNEQISIDINNNELQEEFIVPLGGERRLAKFTRCQEDEALWSCPISELGKNLRIIMATPGIFDNGWLPGWISKENLIGKFPNTNATVKLISAIVDRWQPVSGWGYTRGHTGPKPMRRAVPSGSVYFFEILEGEINPADIWLNSICDKEQDINDGFGLVLVGKWQKF